MRCSLTPPCVTAPTFSRQSGSCFYNLHASVGSWWQSVWQYDVRHVFFFLFLFVFCFFCLFWEKFLRPLSLCLIFESSVVSQEERLACSEGASTESRVQAEQDPLLHHHDGLQPQLLFRREGHLTQWAERSTTQEHHTSQVGHSVSLYAQCLHVFSCCVLHCFFFVFFFSFEELLAMVRLVKSMKDKFWGWAVITVPCRWP